MKPVATSAGSSNSMSVMSRRLLATLLLTVPAAAQSTWYVDDDGIPPGTGTLGDPYTLIQYAIEQPGTLPGDTILVQPGLYLEQLDLKSKALRIEGVDGPDATVVDSQGAGTVVTLASGEGPGVVLQGLTLRNGVGAVRASGLVTGGGIYAVSAEALVRDCVIQGCAASDAGGGVFALFSDLEFEDTVVTGCLEGGGLHAELSTFVLRDCEVSENERVAAFDSPSGSGITAHLSVVSLEDSEVRANGTPLGGFDRGGGIHAEDSLLHLQSCLVAENRNEYRGGGLSLIDSPATLFDCTIRDNESVDAYYGGGIYVAAGIGAGALTVVDCTFEGNWSGDGGAVYLGAGTHAFQACEFLDNVASAFPFYIEEGRGGAVHLASGAGAEFLGCVFAGNVATGDDDLLAGRGGAVYGAAELDRCTLVQNRAESAFALPGGGACWGGTLVDSIAWANLPDSLDGGTVAATSCVEGGWPGDGVIAADPSLWSLAERDLALLPESPCIGTASSGDMGAIAYDRDYCGTGCTGPIGTESCFAAVNSTGNAARMRGLGDPVLASDLLLIFVDDLPPFAPGVLLVSDLSQPRPIAPFGKAKICVGAPRVLRRLDADAGGRVDVHAALATWPGAATVAVGETWTFQHWFLDDDPTPISNSSSALSITFQ